MVYSLAWGDQPALICEQVDWARAAGFKVICAGKGTRYEPHYHKSNPDNVWDILDKYLNITDRKSINPKMFNSFVDGTKSGIEMTAVCNATGLVPQSDGLHFPPATRFELADICKPKSAGGTLEKEGVTEVVSSVYRDGRDVPHHLALGTYVVFEGETEYARRCFKEYAMLPDKSGKYAALYRPIHMIGLELGISVASCRAAQRADRRAHRLPLRRGGDRQARSESRRDAGRRGRLLRLGQADAGRCVAERELLPLGLAHNVKLKRDIAEGGALKWADVAYDANDAGGESAARDGSRLRPPQCRRAGGLNGALLQLDGAGDLVAQADLADGQHHLGLQRLVALDPAAGDRRADGAFDLALRGDADGLQEFAQRGVEDLFVHGDLLEKGMFGPILVRRAPADSA